MPFYEKELRRETSKYQVDYGTSQMDRYMYTSFYDTRAELIASLRELIIEFNFIQITKIISNETV